jgi:hypothetical protein
MLSNISRDFTRMAREIRDDGLDHTRKVGLLHAHRIDIRAGLKHDRVIFCQEPIHDLSRRQLIGELSSW